MNNVMLAAMLGGWEVLVIFLVVLFWVAVVGGGIVFLVVWLIRRGKMKTSVNPPVQPWQPKPKREKPFKARRSWLVLAFISVVTIVGFLIHRQQQSSVDILTQKEFLDALQAHQVIKATVYPGQFNLARVTGEYKKSDHTGTLVENKFATKILLAGKNEEALLSLGNLTVITPNNSDKRVLAVFPFAIFLLILLSVVAGAGWLIVWLVRRKHNPPSSTPPVQPQPEQPKPDPSTCPRCGTPLPADTPQGLCPRCVMGVGIATQTEATSEFGPHDTKVVPPPQSDVARRFPHLEILDCLGHGGMGVVYKARQPKLNRIVALKILAPEKGADPKFAERFLREAQALARLNHPNIVTVHDFGEADGMFYLLMEYVDGATLRQLLREGRMKPETALAIVPRICEALQFAHDQGVVHRDIKPENVLLDKQGRVKIADFGIAKIVEGTPLTPSLSPSDGERVSARTGEGNLTQDQVLGTPHYMAPEQVERPQTVDHRADIYSLGVVFYEMLTGELPLGKFQPPSKKVQVDVRLDEIVLRALEKEPERRYQQASVLKTDVETVATTPQPALKSIAPSATMSSEQQHDVALHNLESPSANGRASSTRWMFPLGSGWILLAIILLLGRTVARTQPLMYAFFGIGGWLYPSGYNAIVGLTVIAGLFCVWLGWVSERGSSNWPLGQLSLAVLVASPWLLVMITLMLGKKSVRWNPTMYAFYGVGGWMNPSTYNTLIGTCVFIALVSFGVIWLRGHRHQRANIAKLKTKGREATGQLLFSRTAIVGAILSSLFFVATLFYFRATQEIVATSGGPRPGPTWWQILLRLTLLPLGLIAPFGTTILGWISVSQIRHSAGKLYGLGLAVFDGLLFPLLALDGFILILGIGLVSFAHDWINQQGLHESVWHTLVPLLLALLIYGGIAIADYWIIRRVWRAVTKPVGGLSASASASLGTAPVVGQSRSGWGWVAGMVALHAIVLVASVAFFVLLVPQFKQLFGDFGSKLPAVTLVTLQFGRFVKDGGYLLVPVILAADLAISLLLLKFAGRKLVGVWGSIFFLAIVIPVGASIGALFLPLSSIYTRLHEGKPPQATAQPGSKIHPAVAQDLTFGPVVERVIQPLVSGMTNNFLALDTGRLLTPPPVIADLLTGKQADALFAGDRGAQVADWIKQSGTSLLLYDRSGAIAAIGGTYAQAHGPDYQTWDNWDALTTTEVREAITLLERSQTAADQGRNHGLGPTSLLTREQSANWFFKNRNGTLGILQIAGTNAHPLGVKIRYKLVQAQPKVLKRQSSVIARNVMAVGSLKRTRLDGTQWEIDAMVHEADIAPVEPGQNVTFTLEAFPARTFRGKVVAVADAPTTVQHLNYYTTSIRVTDADPKFKPGMTATVSILLSSDSALSTSEQRGFSPVIERTLNLDDWIWFIDLDTGRTVSARKEKHKEGRDWLAKNGIDAEGNVGKDSFGLLCFDMTVNEIAGDRWDTITASEIEKELKKRQSQSGDPTMMAKKGKLGGTYVFKTRESGIGILQLTGFTEIPRSVTIRYKLVQRSPFSAQAPPVDIPSR